MFTPEEDLDEPLAVRLDLRAAGRRLLRRDHEPPTPTLQWKAGKDVTYELPLVFAIYPDLPVDEREVSLFVGFLEPGTRTPRPPRGARRTAENTIWVGDFELPPPNETSVEATLDATIAAALEASGENRHEEAWNILEAAFRRTVEYSTKAKLRDALRKVGKFPPPPLTFEEQNIVAARIAGEQRRYLRQVAGRMYDRGQLHGALRILDRIGGDLREAADRAVLGALRDAENITKDKEDIERKILDTITKEQKDEVVALREKHGETKRLFDVARKLAKKSESRPVARALLRQLGFVIDDELRAAAKEARAKLEEDWLADCPADQRQAADAALGHPCWARTESRASHRFVFLGPKNLIDAIPADSTLNFDIAYVYLTDLFGRVPNPEGDRVTVYFKELWEFGGGVGGGKIIDIGRADPNNRKVRVDTGLLYHELTHCVDDTTPIYAGFREGLADLGAAFVIAEIGKRGQARAIIGNHLRAFQEDYVQRDLEYWRIPNYGPSAGFLLHFVTTYGKDGSGYRWDLYRRFFRDYRACQVKDARTPMIARAFGHHIAEIFGGDAFADLLRFRWPLVESDLRATELEHQHAVHGHNAFERDFVDFERSPVPGDLRATELVRERGRPDDAERVLGVLRDWQVIGPFKKPGANTDTFVFPPEYEVDLDARYTVPNHSATWRKPRRDPPVTVEGVGWLKYDFAYQNDTAIYALTHVSVDKATDAFLHFRSDDDLTVFLNDELVGKHRFARGPVGPWRPGRRTMLADAIRFRVKLEPGRNKLLVKVYNRAGASGLIAAITRLDGRPLLQWSSDDAAPKKPTTRIEMPDPKKWSSRLALRFHKASAARKLENKVGEFRMRRKALEGKSTDRGVAWRKYTVRPGFPKDSPSNLAWLKERDTKNLDAFWLRLGFDRKAGAPKLCVIFQGDGGRDALPGWTLILEPRGERVRARLERYDRLVYSSDWVELGSDDDEPLILDMQYHHRRLHATLGDATLFDQVPLRPIPGRNRIGIASWGPATRITELRLRAPARTR